MKPIYRLAGCDCNGHISNKFASEYTLPQTSINSDFSDDGQCLSDCIYVDVNMTTYNTIDVQLIYGLMVNIIILRSVVCRFELLTSQNKDCKIGICCFSAKHPVLRSKSRYLILLPAYNLKRKQLQNKFQLFTHNYY